MRVRSGLVADLDLVLEELSVVVFDIVGDDFGEDSVFGPGSARRSGDAERIPDRHLRGEGEIGDVGRVGLGSREEVVERLFASALMARKAPAMRSIGIDRDQRALDRFRCEYPVELVHGCAHAFLASFAFRGTELVYSDPPYLHATRRSDRRYRYEYTDADHATLLALLRSLACQVMVSGHPSALYDEMLSDWRRVAVQVTTQAQVRTEVVWFNFAPEPMHWASHAGRNAAERQRIKRKAARWAQGYRTMPAGERLAVLSAIMAVEAE